MGKGVKEYKTLGTYNLYNPENGNKSTLTLRLEHSYTQSIKENETTLKLRFQVIIGSGWYIDPYAATKSYLYVPSAAKDQKKTYDASLNVNYNGKYTNGTSYAGPEQTFIIKHNDAGVAGNNGSVAIGWYWSAKSDSEYGDVNKPSGSFTISIEKINRVSSISSISNAAVENETTITINNYNNNYTNTIQWYVEKAVANITAGWKNAITLGKGVTQGKVNVAKAFYSHIGEKGTGTVRVRCVTKDGSTQIGISSEKTFTVSLNDNCKPVIESFGLSYGIKTEGVTEEKIIEDSDQREVLFSKDKINSLTIKPVIKYTNANYLAYSGAGQSNHSLTLNYGSLSKTVNFNPNISTANSSVEVSINISDLATNSSNFNFSIKNKNGKVSNTQSKTLPIELYQDIDTKSETSLTRSTGAEVSSYVGIEKLNIKGTYFQVTDKDKLLFTITASDGTNPIKIKDNNLEGSNFSDFIKIEKTGLSKTFELELGNYEFQARTDTDEEGKQIVYKKIKINIEAKHLSEDSSVAYSAFSESFTYTIEPSFSWSADDFEFNVLTIHKEPIEIKASQKNGKGWYSLSSKSGGGLVLNNCDITKANGIYFADQCAHDGEGFYFPTADTGTYADHYDRLRANNGHVKFLPRTPTNSTEYKFNRIPGDEVKLPKNSFYNCVHYGSKFTIMIPVNRILCGTGAYLKEDSRIRFISHEGIVKVKISDGTSAAADFIFKGTATSPAKNGIILKDSSSGTSRGSFTVSSSQTEAGIIIEVTPTLSSGNSFENLATAKPMYAYIWNVDSTLVYT